MIDSSIDHKNQLVVHVCTGVVTLDEIMETIRAFYVFDATRDTLWDFTAAADVATSAEDVQHIAELTTPLTETRPGGRTALVASGDFTFGLGRMYQTLAELAGQAVDVQVFRTVAEAREWLQSPRTPA